MAHLHNPSEPAFKQWWRRLSPKKKRVCKVLLGVAAFIGLILLIVAIFALMYMGVAKTVLAEAMAAKENFEAAQVSVQKQDFDRATEQLQEASTHFEAAYTAFQPLNTYQFLPGLEAQLKTADHLLLAGKNLTAGASKLTNLAVQVNDVIKEKEGEVTFADISPEDKHEILKTLQESSPDLIGVKADIELAVLLIEDIPEKGLLKPIKNAVEPIKQQLPLLEAVISQVIPAAQSLPSLAGYPTEKTYLFLLQNNRELRPTGGFIGTYGILKVLDGEMTNFDTDNVYNLDAPAEDIVTEPSPDPIAQHTGTKKWFLRDINWSPDFPTTAQKAESKYQEEGGAEQQIDGVIAVTPTFIESLLRLTGPITAGGIEFNADNFFEKLEYQVEFGYNQQGVSDADRKDIISDLSKQLMDELFGLPKSKFQNLWKTFVENVDEKQIVIYLDDPLTQSLIIEENWAGEMKEYSTDYVLFVDANMAALKTDEKMERRLTHTLTQDDGTFVSTAEMYYKNNTQTINKLYTRYRSHTRVYLPKGAQIVDTSGFVTGDRYLGGRPTQPEIYEETFTQANGTSVTYTVAAGFISVEPQEDLTVRISYILPEASQEQIKNGTYDLYVQRQAGTINHYAAKQEKETGEPYTDLFVHINTNKKIDQAIPFDFLKPTGDNNVSFEGNLQTDREFHIEFK